jgi:NADH-quinone oxidoreductase subunit N
MNISLISLDMAVALLGLGLLLLDLVTPLERKTQLGYAAAFALALVLGFSFLVEGRGVSLAFGGCYVLDPLALFFKRLFLAAGVLVLLLATSFSGRLRSGITEYYSLILLALTGMMFASSVNHFTLLFVALELITVSFYVLVGFQRNRLASLEAGVKYLIMGALSSGFMVYGIALIYGAVGTMSFDGLARALATQPALAGSPILLAGLVFVLVGLGFKVAAVPFQMWAPDVYQGAPTPTTAFLATGSKAAGFVLLLRLLYTALPALAAHWHKLVVVAAVVTILYGNLCAIPQRNLKRLLGYSSIANAGYLLLGLAAWSADGSAAILYYLTGYMFTLMAAFTVIALVTERVEGEDVSCLAGLGQRSPFLAACLTVTMVSLAGVPPLAGFFGKFLLIKAVVAQGMHTSYYFGLAAVAVVGVVISFWYYFGIIRAIYWSSEVTNLSAIEVPVALRLVLVICLVAILFLGVIPGPLLDAARQAVAVLKI